MTRARADKGPTEIKKRVLGNGGRAEGTVETISLIAMRR